MTYNKFDSLKNRIIDMERALTIRYGTYDTWHSINKKSNVVEGYIKPLKDLEAMGYSFKFYTQEKVQIVHPCGKHLTTLKKILEDKDLLRFRFKETRDDNSRTIWTVLKYSNNGYGSSVYGDMFIIVDKSHLEDDLFKI